MSSPIDHTPATKSSSLFAKVFFGLFLRDLGVLVRKLLPFLPRVGMQSLLFLFCVYFILPRMGEANPVSVGGGANFGTIILPGLMTVAIVSLDIVAVALLLSSEFGITREIDGWDMFPPSPCVLSHSRRFAPVHCKASSLHCWLFL